MVLCEVPLPTRLVRYCSCQQLDRAVNQSATFETIWRPSRKAICEKKNIFLNGPLVTDSVPSKIDQFSLKDENAEYFLFFLA